MREQYTPTVLFHPLKIVNSIYSRQVYSSSYGRNVMVTGVMARYTGHLERDIEGLYDRLFRKILKVYLARPLNLELKGILIAVMSHNARVMTMGIIGKIE